MGKGLCLMRSLFPKASAKSQTLGRKRAEVPALYCVPAGMTALCMDFYLEALW